MLFKIIFLAYIVLFEIAKAEWTFPVKVGEVQTTGNYTSVRDLYIDPSNEIAHVVYSSYEQKLYNYSAIWPNGTVKHSTTFADNYDMIERAVTAEPFLAGHLPSLSRNSIAK